MELKASRIWQYRIEDNPEPQKSGVIEFCTTFSVPADMVAPRLTGSRFECSLPAEELIEDDNSPRKQELDCFLRGSGVYEHHARSLIQEVAQVAAQITSLDAYSPQCLLKMCLTLYIFPSHEELVIDHPETEEPVLAPLADETKSGFRPTSKLGLWYLSKRKFKASSSNADRCTICLKAFKTKRRVGTLPCGHEFHYRCILKWLKASHFCPLCRYELPCEER